MYTVYLENVIVVTVCVFRFYHVLRKHAVKEVSIYIFALHAALCLCVTESLYLLKQRV